MSVCVITGDVNLGLLVKVVAAGSLLILASIGGFGLQQLLLWSLPNGDFVQ